MPPTEETPDAETTGQFAPAPRPAWADMLTPKAIAILAALLFGAPGASAAIVQQLAGTTQTASVEQAIGSAEDGDDRIIAHVEQLGRKIDKVGVEVSALREAQQEIQRSINGDATKDEPGIRGTLVRQGKKIEALKKAGDARDDRTMKRDEVRGVKLPPAYDLARDDLWESP